MNKQANNNEQSPLQEKATEKQQKSKTFSEDKRWTYVKSPQEGPPDNGRATKELFERQKTLYMQLCTLQSDLVQKYTKIRSHVLFSS